MKTAGYKLEFSSDGAAAGALEACGRESAGTGWQGHAGVFRNTVFVRTDTELAPDDFSGERCGDGGSLFQRLCLAAAPVSGFRCPLRPLYRVSEEKQVCLPRAETAFTDTGPKKEPPGSCLRAWNRAVREYGACRFFFRAVSQPVLPFTFSSLPSAPSTRGSNTSCSRPSCRCGSGRSTSSRLSAR